MEEEHAVYPYDQYEFYFSISNENKEKQCNEESYWVHLIKYLFHPSTSHTVVPYDLEQFGAYTQSYHQINSFDEFDDLPHYTDLYISHIQSWIEESYKRNF